MLGFLLAWKHPTQGLDWEVCVFLGPKVSERLTSSEVPLREMEDSACVVNQKEAFFLDFILCTLIIQG